MHVFAIANQKGGEGKTTTAVFLARVLQRSGNRVLLIDTDPECAASGLYGWDTEDATVYDVLLGREPIGQAIAYTMRGAIVRSDIRLDRADFGSIEVSILGDALKTLGNEYDYIIIDTPPTNPSLLNIALAAADSVIIPVSTDEMSFFGLDRIYETYFTVKENWNPKLKIDGLLLTKYDESDPASRQAEKKCRLTAEACETRMFDAHIRRFSSEDDPNKTGERLMYDHAGFALELLKTYGR